MALPRTRRHVAAHRGTLCDDKCTHTNTCLMYIIPLFLLVYYVNGSYKKTRLKVEGCCVKL